MDVDELQAGVERRVAELLVRGEQELREGADLQEVMESVLLSREASNLAEFDHLCNLGKVLANIDPLDNIGGYGSLGKTAGGKALRRPRPCRRRARSWSLRRGRRASRPATRAPRSARRGSRGRSRRAAPRRSSAPSRAGRRWPSRRGSGWPRRRGARSRRGPRTFA